MALNENNKKYIKKSRLTQKALANKSGLSLSIEDQIDEYIAYINGLSKNQNNSIVIKDQSGHKID